MQVYQVDSCNTNGNTGFWQAALVSLLPPRLLPSADADRVTIGRVEHLVSWVSDSMSHAVN